MSSSDLGPDHYLVHAELLRDTVRSFDEYPFALPAVRALEILAFHPNVTFLIGDNGTGKSTLMEAIAVGYGLNAEGGSRNFNFATRASHSTLCDFLRLRRGSRRATNAWFLRAESFFNVASEIEKLGIESAYGGVSLHEQSHGESYLAVFENRFNGKGLYLLDEPEAALSPMRQLSFLTLLHQQVRAGAQFIIATHSPIIMAYPDSWIYGFSEKGIAHDVSGDRTLQGHAELPGSAGDDVEGIAGGIVGLSILCSREFGFSLRAPVPVVRHDSMQVQLNDRLYREAQRRAGEAGFSSVDDYIADVISHDLVGEDVVQGPNLQHLFTPERLAEIDAAVEEIKAGDSFTDQQVSEYFRLKRIARDQADRTRISSTLHERYANWIRFGNGTAGVTAQTTQTTTLAF